MKFQLSEFFTGSVAVARGLPTLLLVCVVAGCAITPDSPLTMVPRDGKTMPQTVVFRTFPQTRIVVDIDQRIYMGTSELTSPNQTYGLAFKYGAGNPMPAESSGLAGNRYYRALLSSTDNHVLRCDLIYNNNVQRNGICVDDFHRVYDVISSR